MFCWKEKHKIKISDSFVCFLMFTVSKMYFRYVQINIFLCELEL